MKAARRFPRRVNDVVANLHHESAYGSSLLSAFMMQNVNFRIPIAIHNHDINGKFKWIHNEAHQNCKKPVRMKKDSSNLFNSLLLMLARRIHTTFSQF
jgi:hypothetical protein